MNRPSILNRASLLIATFLGTGYAPVASGTVATAATIPFYLALSMIPSPAWQPWVQIGAVIITTLVGIAVSSAAERHFGLHDPSEIVIDEVAGFLVTMLFIPISLGTVVAGFFLFRIFDIVKPWPAGPAERLGGGLGIMADDIICGIYANLILHLIVGFMV